MRSRNAVPWKLQLLRFASWRFASWRYGLTENSSRLQAFHVSTPCRSIFKWSGFIQEFLFALAT